jgi:hypothetical protein
VRQGPKKVEVAEDGKTRRRRRQPLTAIAPGWRKLRLPGGEEDQDRHEQSEEEEQERRVPKSKE